MTDTTTDTPPVAAAIADLPPEAQALAVAAIRKQCEDLLPVIKATFAHRYANGDTRTFRSPLDGRKLGKVRRDDPDPGWAITNRTALRDWLTEQGRTVAVPSVAEEDWPEVLAVLEEHAPKLLTWSIEVPDAECKAALAETKAKGEATAPGITYVSQDGTVVVSPDTTTGVAAAAALARAGYIDWSKRPELAAGGTASKGAPS